MPVFKMYMMMWKSKLLMICVYTIIFLTIFILFTNYYKNSSTDVDAFSSTKVNIAIHDHDQSTLSKALHTYLVERNHEVLLEEQDEAIKDALFYQKITYYIDIPKGYASSFMANEKPLLTTQQLPNDASAYQVAEQINTFLSNYETYHQRNPMMDSEQLIQQVNTTLSQTTEVRVLNSKDVDSGIIARALFFNYISYIFFAIIMMSCSLILIRVFHKEIRKRQLVAPISNVSFNLQLAAGSLIGIAAIWMIFMAAIQVISGNLWSNGGVYYMINSLVFISVCLSIAFLCANILAGSSHAEEALNGITTFAGLGMCFLGGIFIPQSLLSDTIKMVGSFIPTFWYAKANELLVNIHTYSFADMQEVYFCYGIQLLFALVFFTLALFIAKTKASAHDIS